MPESPAPLSAAELTKERYWLSLCRSCGVTQAEHGPEHPFYWQDGARWLATIDAQATEIAGLRGALEREKRSEWREGLVAVIDHEGNYLGCMGTMTWAVLAGKEDQGD